MFKREQTIRQSLGRIAGQDGHAGLAKNFAGVDLFDNEMHGAAVLSLPCREGAFVCFGSREFWQQRGVDVQQAKRWASAP